MGDTPPHTNCRLLPEGIRRVRPIERRPKSPREVLMSAVLHPSQVVFVLGCSRTEHSAGLENLQGDPQLPAELSMGFSLHVSVCPTIGDARIGIVTLTFKLQSRQVEIFYGNML